MNVGGIVSDTEPRPARFKYIASVGRALLEEAGFCSAGGSGKDKKGGGGASTGKR